jgi:hypothetical protein
MKMTSTTFRRLLLALLFLSPVRHLLSQTLTSATVVGTVTDSSGAVVPGATIRIRQPETDAVRTATSGSAGEYRFPFLKPGNYEITAEAAGLSSARSYFGLLVGQEQSVNLTLGLQSVQQTVDVDTSSGLLQTENGNSVTSYNQQFIENTPINGGDITNIAFSTPGLRLNVGGGNANFNVNGLPFNSVLFTMNGADIVEPYNLNNKSGASNNTLGANDVAEAAVIVNAFSAQYGREAGAQVNYISKSGANRFHGNLVENYNGQFLNGNDYINNSNHTPRGRSVANQYAASIGGPIKRNKIFFYVNTEGLRYALPSSGVVSLPSPQLQSYILSQIPAASQPLYKQLFALYSAAPGVSRAVPVTTGTGTLQDASGNLGCGNQTFGTAAHGAQFGKSGGTSCAIAFGTNASSVNTEYLVSGRVDWNINDKQKLYFRISRDAGVQASSTSPISPVYSKYSIQPWVIPQLNYTYAITPNIVNNFVVSGNFYSAVSGVSNFQQSQSQLGQAFAFTDGGANGSTTTSSGSTTTTTTGFAFVGPALPTGRRGQQLQIIDDLSLTIGKHTLQAGINNRNNRITDSSIASNSIVGTYTFADVTDFVSGVVNSTGKNSKYVQAFPLVQADHTRLNSLNFYGQDEWKVTRRLNITYGVRFELNGNPSCKENCYSLFNAEFLSANYKAGSSVPYNQTIQTGINKTFRNLEGIITEPRLGVAFQPFGEGNMVIRGGVGLFANTFAGSLAASVFGNPPNKFQPNVTAGNVGLSSDLNSSQSVDIASNQAFQSGFSNGGTLAQLQAVTDGRFSPPTYYTNPDNFKSIKVLEWSVEVEQPLTRHDVFALTYSGNHSYSQPLSNTIANAYAAPSKYPSGFGRLPTSIPDPRFSTVTQVLLSGYSNYNGLIAQIRHAMNYGFQAQASYTWSNALQIGPSNTATATIYNPYDLRSNYGPTSFDTRHNFTADIVWNSPRMNSRLLHSTLSGWTTSGKIYLYSGRPFSVINSQIPGQLSSTFGGQVLAQPIDPSVVGTHCSRASVTTPCLTSSQFQTTATQTSFGNIRPNSFRGPGFFTVAAHMAKVVPVREQMHFELGADAYNLFNHANFAVPSNDVSKGSVGLINSTVSSPTSIYGSGQGALVSGRVLVVFGKFIF